MRRLLLGIALLVFAAGTVSAAPSGRSYVAGYFALDLDGQDVGIVEKIAGGDVVAEVATVPRQQGAATDKRIGPTHPGVITIDAGLTHATGLWDWIASS